METRYQKWVLSTEESIARADIREGQKVLDLGCGSGRILIEVARKVGPGGEVVGADLQKGMLAKAKKKIFSESIQNVTLVHGDASKIGLDGENYDRILMIMLVGEVSDRQALFKRLPQLLNSSGIISISEVFPDPHYQTRSSIRRLANIAGLKEQDTFGNFWAYTSNFVKTLTLRLNTKVALKWVFGHRFSWEKNGPVVY